MGVVCLEEEAREGLGKWQQQWRGENGEGVQPQILPPWLSGATGVGSGGGRPSFCGPQVYL